MKFRAILNNEIISLYVFVYHIITRVCKNWLGSSGQLAQNEIAPVMFSELQRLGQKGKIFRKLLSLNF